MTETRGTSRVTIEELNGLLQAGEAPVLLDCLPKARYQQQHLPGAQNACVFEVSFLSQVTAFSADKSRPIVVYGANDQTHDAKTAVGKLLREGYSQVSMLDGGIVAWQNAGYPLEGDLSGENELPAVGLVDGRHQVDIENSLIEWVGRNPNSSHVGTLKLSAGEIRIEAGLVTGNFSIDMTSIENRNLAGNELKPVLEAHLESDDFFFVKMFPEAKFEMKASQTSVAQPVSSPNYQVEGSLSLCGVSAEQNFPATIVTTDEGQLAAEAHFDFDRTRWGVIYGSTKFFEHLGMHLVFDQISLQVRIRTK